MKNIDDLGIQAPQIFLPRKDVNLSKWAVIACDQFTSQPEYWQEVKNIVRNDPSTFNLVLPEVYLETAGVEERVRDIQARMKQYLDADILQPHEGMVYVERDALGKKRKGIVLALDLERYDYNKGSTSLIRATEGTIVERLPPRMKIRQGAALELPHILVLIDDPDDTVIEPLAPSKNSAAKLYDFDLMLGSGHLSGYAIDGKHEEGIIEALRRLAQPAVFSEKYGVKKETPVLLFAMGDGNHSLATAKAIWEKIKASVGPNHPARFALVEIENVHDQGLEFEPIHRVLFGLKRDLLTSLKDFYGADFKLVPVNNAETLIDQVDHPHGTGHTIGLIDGSGPASYSLIEIDHPSSNLPVGTLQAFLDPFMKEGGAEKIDYVHGSEVVCSLGGQAGNAGFYVPGMNKSDLFKTVILDGALPRKTFSMGEAKEKRFYMEARKIV